MAELLTLNGWTINELAHFHDDGLKDCSWIPDVFADFLIYCDTKQLDIDKDSLVITNGDDDFRYLDTIYVKKASRGKGIATRKINELSGRVVLICNKNLVEFYKKFGFTNETPYEIIVKDNRTT